MRPIPTVVGMGDATPFLWITGIDISDADLEVANKFYKGQHTAFMAKSQSTALAHRHSAFSLCLQFSLLANAIHNTDSGEVDQFYAAALKAGATDNGPPGPRPGYPKGYYTAFVIDPVCGINFEVVYNGDGA